MTRVNGQLDENLIPILEFAAEYNERSNLNLDDDLVKIIISQLFSIIGKFDWSETPEILLNDTDRIEYFKRIAGSKPAIHLALLNHQSELKKLYNTIEDKKNKTALDEFIEDENYPNKNIVEGLDSLISSLPNNNSLKLKLQEIFDELEDDKNGTSVKNLSTILNNPYIPLFGPSKVIKTKVMYDRINGKSIPFMRYILESFRFLNDNAQDEEYQGEYLNMAKKDISEYFGNFLGAIKEGWIDAEIYAGKWDSSENSNLDMSLKKKLSYNHFMHFLLKYFTPNDTWTHLNEPGKFRLLALLAGIEESVIHKTSGVDIERRKKEYPLNEPKKLEAYQNSIDQVTASEIRKPKKSK